MTAEKSHEFRNYMTFVGERLKAARNLRKMTQVEAAAAAGLNQSFLSAVESGKKAICTAQIIALIKIYDVPYDFVFDKDGDTPGTSYEPLPIGVDESVDLLKTLVSPKSEGKAENLTGAAEIYIKLCVYVMLRTLYRENPRNSDKVFSIEYDNAMRAAQRIIMRSPEDMVKYIKAVKKSSLVKDLEIPIEKNEALRKFISECESLLHKEE